MKYVKFVADRLADITTIVITEARHHDADLATMSTTNRTSWNSAKAARRRGRRDSVADQPG